LKIGPCSDTTLIPDGGCGGRCDPTRCFHEVEHLLRPAQSIGGEPAGHDQRRVVLLGSLLDGGLDLKRAVAFLASDWLVVESRHVAESVDRLNQRHVLEPIGGKAQYLFVSKRYSIVD
jgi:hypothetical protein